MLGLGIQINTRLSIKEGGFGFYSRSGQRRNDALRGRFRLSSTRANTHTVTASEPPRVSAGQGTLWKVLRLFMF